MIQTRIPLMRVSPETCSDEVASVFRNQLKRGSPQDFLLLVLYSRLGFSRSWLRFRTRLFGCLLHWTSPSEPRSVLEPRCSFPLRRPRSLTVAAYLAFALCQAS